MALGAGYLIPECQNYSQVLICYQGNLFSAIHPSFFISLSFWLTVKMVFCTFQNQWFKHITKVSSYRMIEVVKYKRYSMVKCIWVPLKWNSPVALQEGLYEQGAEKQKEPLQEHAYHIFRLLIYRSPFSYRIDLMLHGTKKGKCNCSQHSDICERLPQYIFFIFIEFFCFPSLSGNYLLWHAALFRVL